MQRGEIVNTERKREDEISETDQRKCNPNPTSITFLYLKCVCTRDETGSIRILAQCVRERK